MKLTVMKIGAATMLASAAAYFGTLAAPLCILLFAMLLDYVTGMVKAYVTAQLCSRTGIKGILKKLCYMAMVAVGVVADYLLESALTAAGINMPLQMFCGILVCVWLIINELISVLENLAAIGVPGFPALQKLLSHLRNTVSAGMDDRTGGS